jgi:hypothetical protein
MTLLFKQISDRWYKSQAGQYTFQRFAWEIHNYLTLGEQRDEAESEDLCGCSGYFGCLGHCRCFCSITG